MEILGQFSPEIDSWKKVSAEILAVSANAR